MMLRGLIVAAPSCVENSVHTFQCRFFLGGGRGKVVTPLFISLWDSPIFFVTDLCKSGLNGEGEGRRKEASNFGKLKAQR